AKADPFGLLQQLAEALLDLAQHAVEQAEIAVLAIVVDHEAADAVHERHDLGLIPFAKTAERARGVCEIEGGGRDAGVETQATDDAGRIAGKPLELLDRVEDDLVGVGYRLIDLVIGPGDRI